MVDGGVLCWGANDFGQLGDGTVVERLIPVSVELGGDVTVSEVSAGASHSCAKLDNGGVRCWGGNTFGQLGDGTTLDSTNPIAINVGGNGLALELSSGSYHTCAITTERKVECLSLIHI